MILQRMTSAIKRQDWFQVTTEILIVVIGIFLGFQVTQWNEERVEKMEEQDYLIRLHQDFTKSITLNRARIDDLNRLVNYSKLLKKSLEQCLLSEQERDNFASGLYLIGKTIPPTLVNGVIEELKSTGKFQLISNVSLRTAISNHIQFMNDIYYIDDKSVERARPHIIYIEQQLFYNLQEDNVGTQDISKEELLFDFDKICTDSRFKQAVSAVGSYNFSYIARLNDTITQQMNIISIIERDISSIN